MTEDAAPASREQDRALLRGVFIVTVFAAIAGAARVGQDAAIAWRFGAGQTVDAYYYLLTLVSWPVAVALSTLTLLVAPVDATRKAAEVADGMHFRGELLGAVLLFALVTLPPMWWALSAIAGSPLGGLERGAAALAKDAVPAIVWTVPLGLMGALLAAWLVARGRHLLTLLEALPPLVLIVALLAVPGSTLFWGTTAGIALQVAAMTLALRAAGEMPRPRLGMSAQAWPAFAQGAYALLAGQMLFTLVPLVDPFFAARQGDGMVAALSYANRLVLGLQGLAGLALQRAGLPLLSRWMATAPGAARRAALRWALVAAGAGAALGVLVATLADPIVSLLYERGRFTAGDSAQVAMLLRYGMLQMPAFLAGLTLVTALASASARRDLALIAGGGLVAKLALSTWLVGRYGVSGLLLATALMYTTTALLAWFALAQRWRSA